MADKFYTNERNVQIVIALLKEYGVKKIIASPGTTNFTFVGSIQQDSYFEVYSSVDERSAAYIACGMAAESGEPVALTCTGATASRNYYPGLTEAFYRKLPVVAITATQDPSRIGHNIAQVIDRRVVASDLVVASEHIQIVSKSTDEFDVTIKTNRALHALTANGGGPIHLNLETTYSRDFSVRELPPVRVIKYFSLHDELPPIPEGRIGVFVGNHRPMSSCLRKAIDSFCSTYNAVAFCDHTSNYEGEYRVNNSLVGVQDKYKSEICKLDLLIHIGNVTGAYDLMAAFSVSKEWRVAEDGKTCDTFGHLDSLFTMSEMDFFCSYAQSSDSKNNSFAIACQEEYKSIVSQLDDIPFSNLWIAKNTLSLLPNDSVLHLGILNTLRCWNYFEKPKTVTGFSNTGGFGIDGNLSSVIGAALASPNKLFFLIVGDLAFFYDLNSLANRHVPSNIRILLVNNGKGVEFRSPYHPCNMWAEDADKYMAAAGHFGNQSSLLIQHFATDLGYDYYSASSKDEYLENLPKFVSSKMPQKPMIFETFIQTLDEQEAIAKAHSIVVNKGQEFQNKLKSIVKTITPRAILNTIRNCIR